MCRILVVGEGCSKSSQTNIPTIIIIVLLCLLVISVITNVSTKCYTKRKKRDNLQN